MPTEFRRTSQLIIEEEEEPNEPGFDFALLRLILRTKVAKELLPFAWLSFEADYQHKRDAELEIRFKDLPDVEDNESDFSDLDSDASQVTDPVDAALNKRSNEKWEAVLFSEHVKKQLRLNQSIFSDACDLFAKCHNHISTDYRLAPSMIKEICRMNSKEQEEYENTEQKAQRLMRELAQAHKDFEKHKKKMLSLRRKRLSSHIEFYARKCHHDRLVDVITFWRYKASESIKKRLEMNLDVANDAYAAKERQILKMKEEWAEIEAQHAAEVDEHKRILAELEEVIEAEKRNKELIEKTLRENRKKGATIETLQQDCDLLRILKLELEQKLAAAEEKIAKLEENLRDLKIRYEQTLLERSKLKDQLTKVSGHCEQLEMELKETQNTLAKERAENEATVAHLTEGVNEGLRWKQKCLDTEEELERTRKFLSDEQNRFAKELSDANKERDYYAEKLEEEEMNHENTREEWKANIIIVKEEEAENARQAIAKREAELAQHIALLEGRITIQTDELKYYETFTSGTEALCPIPLPENATVCSKCRVGVIVEIRPNFAGEIPKKRKSKPPKHQSLPALQTIVEGQLVPAHSKKQKTSSHNHRPIIRNKNGPFLKPGMWDSQMTSVATTPSLNSESSIAQKALLLALSRIREGPQLSTHQLDSIRELAESVVDNRDDRPDIIRVR